MEERTLLSESGLVYPGADGRLVYVPDAQGNTIPDFSDVGYMSGTVPLPDTPGGVTVPVQVSLSPTGGDQTARIQAAIDQVSALPPDANGFRGAVLLHAGEYDIAGTLVITTSGVVLRGEGQDLTTGTVLRATGVRPAADASSLIQISGTGSPTRVSGTTHNITDSYVPVGARSFHVDSTAGLAVGDSVIVERPSTAEWIQAIGMDQLANPWAPGTKNLRSDRVITAINGNQITLDAPLTNSLDQQYGGGTIYKYTFPGRIQQVGVENLAGISDFNPNVLDSQGNQVDEDHAWDFIHLTAVDNAWVRQVTADHFVYSAVDMTMAVGTTASYDKWITVDTASNLDPISTITGERRYSFNVGGQLTLVKNCYARGGRHDFIVGALVPGPNVFVDCRADLTLNEAGPHERWSTGALFDNVVVHGDPLGDPNRAGSIDVRNALNEGTGHGWQGANMVLWNDEADAMRVFSPPTAQNWVIGAITSNRIGDAIWDVFGAHVDTRSLYYAQLQDRLGGSQVGAPASFVVSGFPSPTTAGTSNTFTVTAKDVNGNTVPGYTGTVHFSSSDAQGVLPADYTFTAADAGTHTFSATLNTAGTQTITVADTSTGSLTGIAGNITVSPAAASTLIVAGFPSSTSAGVAHSFTVTAVDPYGNIATGYTGTIHISSSDSQAVLPADSTLTNGTGQLSATLNTAGTQSLTATDTTSAGLTGTQGGITVSDVASVVTLAVAGFPSPITAGVGGSFTVTAKDANGNVATWYTGTVVFSSSDGQAVLAGAYTFTAADRGVHTFSATLSTAGTQSITVTDTATAALSGSDAGITVNPGAATASTFLISAPASVSSGVAFSLTVEAVDGFGNVVTGYRGTVHFTSTDTTAYLPGDRTFTSAEEGVRTFNGVRLRTRGSQTITITDTLNGSIIGSVIVNVI
jgi:hypothetical protein